MLRPQRTTQVSPILLVLLALVGLSSLGCTTRVYGRGYARGAVRYSAPVAFVQAPDLVYVEPGVYVVRDYGDAVYYSDGYYWSSRGGVWYRTAHWNDPWVTVHMNVVPRTFVHRDHRAYVRYHGTAGAATYRQPARTYTASASVHHKTSAPPSPAPPAANGGGSGGADPPMVHSGDRSAARGAAGSDRSMAPPSDTQAKVIAPPADRPARSENARPARSDKGKQKARSSDSPPTRSTKKTKRR
jgi:hypothetical protein